MPKCSHCNEAEAHAERKNALLEANMLVKGLDLPSADGVPAYSFADVLGAATFIITGEATFE